MITNLDDLKGKLIGVVIVLLAVTFLGKIVSWDGSTTILALGISTGLVLLALETSEGMEAEAMPARGLFAVIHRTWLSPKLM